VQIGGNCTGLASLPDACFKSKCIDNICQNITSINAPIQSEDVPVDGAGIIWTKVLMIDRDQLPLMSGRVTAISKGWRSVAHPLRDPIFPEFPVSVIS
jgi:hypothetical protein